MNFRKTARSITVAFPLIFALLPRPASADFFLHHWEDHYEPFHFVSVQGDLIYYSTSQNYGPTGILSATPNSDSYQRFEADGLVQLGLLDRMSFFGRLTWAHVQSNNSIASASNSGLVDQSAGATFRIYEGSMDHGTWLPFSFDLQGQADFPGYSNGGDDQARTPYLGDQTLDLTVGGFFEVPVSQDTERAYWIEGGAGYTYRTSHFSSEVPWTLAIVTAPKNDGITARFAAFGTTSMNQDTTIATSKPSGFATGAGGSLITDAINPEAIVLRGELGYQIQTGARIYLAYEQSIWGENSPDDQMVSAGFKLSFGPRSEEGSAYSKANQGIQDYSLEALVTKSNDRLNLVKIDKGSSDGIEKGQIFDLFSVNGGGHATEAVARAQVTSVKSDEAALTIIEYFKEQNIKEGFVAKRLVQ
jgi:hypothetical protein